MKRLKYNLVWIHRNVVATSGRWLYKQQLHLAAEALSMECGNA